MMDKEAILENGLIERYVIGELEGTEKEALEQLLAEDQELKAYFGEVEEGLKRVATENAIAPPNAIKDRLMMQIGDPVFMAINEEVTSGQESLNASEESGKSGSNWPLAIAASFALLFFASSVWFYNQWQSSELNAAKLTEDLNQINSRMVSTQQTLLDAQKWNALMKKPRTDKVVLKGNSLSPDLFAVTFLNHVDKEVYINTEQLPKLTDAQTYQLWADVDGVMIDMGTISTDAEMISMKYIERAESLNVTIEPAGGSIHPTVENLVANTYL
ncbi:MAG: anti-sigma factor [Bacteroidota bacterium]